jgi:hypothetical protein
VVADELKKARRLARSGLATNYILMTNYRVSGPTEAEIRAAFLDIKGIQEFLLFGKEWMTLRIRESPRLRMLVPRVYGLGDLSEILDERAYTQAIHILSSMGDDLAKFVVTNPYIRGVNALLKEGFVLLLGQPATGKSTIAAALSMGALDVWGCSTVKIRHPDEFVQHWNPNEPRQFFWCDDAFGTTQYQPQMVYDWNLALRHVKAAIKKGARFLFTSRDYIYNAARFDLKVGEFPLLQSSQVVIDVQRLTQEEKDQILYNHIKLGGQPQEFRKVIKPFLPAVSRSPNFLPEIARRLGESVFTSGLEPTIGSIMRFVEQPVGFLVEVISNMDNASQSALALIFMRGGALESPVDLSGEESKALSFLGADMASVRNALVALNGSLISLVKGSERDVWTFKHPTIGDAYASLVADNPEWLDIYLSWTRPEKLIEEVTCGDLGLQGVKVIVPANKFPHFLARLDELKLAENLFTFLTSRCSQEFLRLFIERRPEIGERLTSSHSYLSVTREVALLVRLHSFGLLPEEWRQQFVERVRLLAIETPDADFLLDDIRQLLKPPEIEAILSLVVEELLPSLDDTIQSWEDSYDRREDPGDWFSPLSQALRLYKSEFAANTAAVAMLDEALSKIGVTVDNLIERHLEYRYEERTIDPTDLPRIEPNRSIFDDIDE